MIFPATKRQKLNKGKGRATSEDVLTFDEDDERGLLDDLIAVGSEAVEVEEDGGVIGEPEESLLASFRESRAAFPQSRTYLNARSRCL